MMSSINFKNIPTKETEVGIFYNNFFTFLLNLKGEFINSL